MSTCLEELLQLEAPSLEVSRTEPDVLKRRRREPSLPEGVDTKANSLEIPHGVAPLVHLTHREANHLQLGGRVAHLHEASAEHMHVTSI